MGFTLHGFYIAMGGRFLTLGAVLALVMLAVGMVNAWGEDHEEVVAWLVTPRVTPEYVPWSEWELVTVTGAPGV